MFRINVVVVLAILLSAIHAEAAKHKTPLRIRHQAPAFVERYASFELSFSVPGINPKDVQEAYLFHRLNGKMGYQQTPARLVNSTFKARLSVDSRQATSMEYYFVVYKNDGSKITYPASKASQDPIRVDVVDPHKSERQRRVEATGVDYTILSPEPGSTVAQEDVVAAITLFYDPAEVDTSRSSFRMFVDDREVTEQASASAYFYTYSPDELAGGAHTITFALQKPDTALTVAEWKFTVLGPNMQRSAQAEGTGEWTPTGNVELAARSQQVGGYGNDALSGNVSLSGQKGNISYSAHGLLTTQADPRLQQQNRFGASLYVGDWLELEAGHVYPVLNDLTIAGRRMQGVDAGFHVWDDALNLRLIYGKLRRGIDNLYDTIEVDQQNLQGSQQPLTTYSLSTSDAGTFRRKVMGGRIGIGGSDTFKFGLNFMKVEDDTSSIRLIDDYNSLMDENADLADGLSPVQRQQLSQHPQQLNVDGNPTPKGNFVAATDVETNLDNNRIHFEANGGVSLLNQDISEGVLTQQTAEDLGLTLDNGTKTLLDQLSWLIIINENMETLPIRFNSGNSAVVAETYFPTSILATQSQLGLSYYDNNLKIRYRWVGPGFNSLANTTIRKDIAGYSVTDRLHFLGNRIYLTLGYERLHDNVVNNKDATTKTTTYRTNVSWYPVDPDLPRVSVGLMKRTRDNGVGMNNPLVAATGGVGESAAVQNLTIQSGDTLLAPHPRYSDTYQLTASVSQEFSVLGIDNDASINFSMLNTTDEVFKYGDASSNNLSLRVVNQYPSLPLQTNLSFNFNNTQTSSGLTDIQIIGLNVGGQYFLMDNKLRLNMSLAFTKNRTDSHSLTTDSNGTPQLTFDDYYKKSSSASVSRSNSYIVGGGARYNLNTHHSFVVNFRYSNVRNTLSSSRTFPNDHLMQLRYIFNF